MTGAKTAGAKRIKMDWEKVFGFKKNPASYGKYVRKYSPDRRRILVFDPGLEVSMMRYEFAFRLIEPDGTVLESFRELSSPLQFAWWSADSRIVAVPAIAQAYSCLLLFNPSRRLYAVIRSDPYLETPSVSPRGARIGVDPEQFHWIFGDELRPPDPVSFPFSSLTWAPPPATWRIDPVIRRAVAPWWHSKEQMKAYAKKQGLSLPRFG